MIWERVSVCWYSQSRNDRCCQVCWYLCVVSARLLWNTSKGKSAAGARLPSLPKRISHCSSSNLRVAMSKRTDRAFRWLLLCLFIMYILLITRSHRCALDREDSLTSKRRRHKRASSELIRSKNATERDRIQRAIVIFYPDNQEKKYLPELRWLYRSWLEMMKSGEPSDWRTDLVIFTGSFTSNLQQLACLYDRARSTKEESPQCRVFHYLRISARQPPDNSSTDRTRAELLVEHLHTYNYIDSINIIFEGHSVLKMYDYILRTDIDVFLTKYFAFHIPITETTLLAGHGGYSVEFNMHRLRRIAVDMGWEYANMSNIGSSW